MVQILDDVDNLHGSSLLLAYIWYLSTTRVTIFVKVGLRYRLDKCDKISRVPFNRKFVSPQHSS